MRSYDQFCGLAKALDTVGDRWSLLIVRELLLRGPSRYTDLYEGLPGIATNLLAARLRDLESSGVVTREDARPPIATTLFRLTAWGEQLRPILEAFGRWARPLMASSEPGDSCRAHWLAMPLETMLVDRHPRAAPVRLELRVPNDEDAVVLETVGGKVRVRPSSDDKVDAVLSGPPEVILGLLAGRIDLPAARARRLHVRGSQRAISRFVPRDESPPRRRRKG